MANSALYTARQLSRVIWYSAQYHLTRRHALRSYNEVERAESQAMQWPDMRCIRQGMAEVFRRDWGNIAAGLYPPPNGGMAASVASARRSLAYFRDLPAVFDRRRSQRANEPATPENRARYPRYYLQNFHFQSGGWFSADSARLYEHQVEVLFGGTAGAMRRQALPPLVRRLRRPRGSRPRLLDVATGTGAFLTELKAAIPRARLAGLDLSRDYLGQAARRIPSADFYEAPAEAMPFAEATFDGISAVYLFHELPPAVRRRVAAEISRVLRPGGIFALVDALQLGDDPVFDPLLGFFPKRFHEPYFSSYVREDIPALFAAAGLCLERAEPIYLSKVFVFFKPEGG